MERDAGRAIGDCYWAFLRHPWPLKRNVSTQLGTANCCEAAEVDHVVSVASVRAQGVSQHRVKFGNP